MIPNEDELSDELARVRVSFSETAEAYRKSPAHGSPVDLARMLEVVAPKAGEAVLDVASGGGHTAVALGETGAFVIALDVTPAMLRETRHLAQQKKVSLRSRVLADGQLLPFARRSFEIVTSRLAVHHFRGAHLAIREMSRVLRPGGRLYIFDLSAPDEPELGVLLNDVERLRDPSHMDSHPPSHWRRMIETVGLEIRHFHWMNRAPYDMETWFERSRTPKPARKEVFKKLAQANLAAKKVFQIEEHEDAWRFGSPVIEILAVKR